MALTLASPGSQLDYYQSVIDKMGASTVADFARFFVMGGTNHGGAGTNYTKNGDGQAIPAAPLASTYDRLTVLMQWVEQGVAPPKNGLVATSGQGRTQKLCMYPAYPKYMSGPADAEGSYECATP